MDYGEIVPNELLIHARLEKEWTQAKLAEEVGATFETVSRWERGIIIPSPYYRRQLCNVFAKTALELGLDVADSAVLPAPPSSSVFLSSTYADAESKFVITLKRELKARGITLWSSYTVKRQAPKHKKAVLQDAIQAVQLVLVIVSSRTPGSHHVKYTSELARYFRKPLCAVWLEGDSVQECLPEQSGEPNMVIDAREGDEQLLCKKIVTTIEQVWLTPSNPATAGLSEPMWNVPEPTAPLIGREELLAHLSTLLRNPDVRLLTLSGPGGIGKTHLAIQVAIEMRERFVDGVCFVSLAAIRDPELVILTIAKELGIREVGDSSLLEQVKVALKNKHFLLLLDNFEHVLEAASQLTTLRLVCPHLKMVVTSRARLRVQGEELLQVPPLALPDATVPLDLDTLAHNAAVRLFLQYSRAAGSHIEWHLTNAQTILRICERLDGLPLAIKLAAARTAVSLEHLLERLKEHPELVLVDKDRDVTDRQRSLEKTIEWSYNLLDQGQQQLFRRLAVFAGSCSLEAVEALCEAIGDGTFPVWEDVESLLDKSLLQAAEQKGEGRLRFLETIREYALAHLKASGEEEITRRAHAMYYLRLVEEAEFHLKGEQQPRWLERLEQELENVQVALDWLIERKEAKQALRFCGALWRFWRLHGYWSEGRRWLKAALELVSAAEATTEQAWALCAAGDLAFYQDDYIVARSLLEESVRLCRSLKIERILSFAVGTLGVLVHLQDGRATANSLLEESEKRCRALSSSWELAYLLRRLAQLAAQDGQSQQALEYAQESLTLAKGLGDKSLIANTLSTLGEIAARQGDMMQAITYNQEGLSFARELNDKHLVATTLNNLGYFSALQGDLTPATDALDGLKLARELGDRLLINKALQTLGYIAVRQSNLAQAALWFREGLSQAIELGSKDGIGWNLAGLAMVAEAEGRLLQAAHLFGAVETWLDVNIDMNPAEHADYLRVVNIVLTQLGKKAFASAKSEGRSLTPEQVLVAPRSLPVVGAPPSPKYPNGLTNREVEALCLMADGLTNKAIASRLSIDLRTVETYLTSAYSKIGVSTGRNAQRQIDPRIAAARYVANSDLC